ncbi:MAG TPA: DUF3043 domain-containing protein [Mycobacteriales bacterium]|nr:DUF3043 domain-containing protein [Mycobacteriales bacterium]
MKRRTTPADPPAQPVEATPPPKPGGKGRPTPKRSEAQGRRRTAVRPPPTDRKEAARRMREDAKAARLRQRSAIETGAEKDYPPLHAGKERALVRDIIDARRSFAWVAMPALLILIVPLWFSAGNRELAATINLFLLVLMLAVTVDVVIAYRKVKKVLAERFPTGTRERTSTLALYGISRNNQIPARRKPRPRVKRGGTY